MLKIVFRKCVGIDVHSTHITVCIAITDSNDITSYETRIFPTFTENLKECRDWLLLKILLMFVWNQLVNIGYLFITY